MRHQSMSQNFKQAAAARPVLIVPYVWIGDFVRCHSVVRLLRAQHPDRPVDIVSNTLCAPLADYMPGVRRAIQMDDLRVENAMSVTTHSISPTAQNEP